MRQLAILTAALVVLLTPTASRALFHIATISEVMSGVNGDATVQYVEIRMNAGAQNRVANTRLTAFNCDGTSSQILLLVPTDVPNAGAGLHWIMATTTFAAKAGITPDYTWDPSMTGNIDPTCGMVCWGAPGFLPPMPTWSATDPNNYVDCLAYGGYTGPTKTSTHDGTPRSGTPTSLTVGHGMFSLTRVGAAGNNATDFAFACPTPTNNTAATGTFGACTPPSTTTTTTILGATTTTTVTGGTTTTTIRGQARRSKCTSRKLQAAGAKAAAKAGCQAKAAAKGIAVSAACTAGAEAAFRTSWGKAEARGDCLAPVGDRDAIETRVDALLTQLVSGLVRSTSPSKCTSKKLKAAGKSAAARALCSAKKTPAAALACLTKATGKFRVAWTRAESRADCQAPTGDLLVVSGQLDVFIAGLSGALGR